ncbi:hypothetical protein C8Q76DRAFT_797228 [Earliella scabrosa]|nr:hypothetical protein C8Q76DRAFT_797228 [Earliella scabrosa]
MCLGNILKRKHRKVMDTVMSAVNAQVKWVRLTNALQALQFTILTNDARRHIAVPPSPQMAVWWCYGDAHTIMHKPKGNDLAPEEVTSLRKSFEGNYGWNATTFKLQKPEAKLDATAKLPAPGGADASGVDASGADASGADASAVKADASGADASAVKADASAVGADMPAVKTVLEAVKRMRSKKA